MSKENKQLIKTEDNDQYWAIIEDCRAIITERIWRSRLEVILAHGEIGQRICNDQLYKKYGKGNQVFTKRLSNDIGISYSDACRSIQFYEKFKIVSLDGEPWNEFKEGKSITWDKIKKFYLPKVPTQKEARHFITCLLDKDERIIFIKKEYEEYKIQYK